MIYKYRGFDTKTNSWVYGYPVPDKANDSWYIYSNNKDFVKIDDPKTITANTMIKDVLDNYIFHKDIIKSLNNTGGWTGVVEFYGGHFWILEIAGNDSGEEKQWSLSINRKVIGNVFENERLLIV